jgi:hypothetical protein
MEISLEKPGYRGSAEISPVRGKVSAGLLSSRTGDTGKRNILTVLFKIFYKACQILWYLPDL